MEKQYIRKAVSAITSTEEFVLLLNQVKRETLGEDAFPFKLHQITYYCNPKRTDVPRYRHFTIPKKGGGERQISAPVPGLKSILMSLNTVLQALYEPSSHVMGFVPGRSVVDNAKMHIGQTYVYNLDLKDFFPSIDKSRVWKRLTLPPMNLSSELAHLIAGLCTMRLEEGESVRYVLPQGAPTSPVITNMICDSLDRQLAKLARRFGLRYSRYADDITFSSMHYVYSEKGKFVREVRRIIEGQNFTINPHKTRLQHPSQRHEVTGLVVSDKVNVTRQYTRELKTLLHIWERYGYVAARESYRRARVGAMGVFDKNEGFNFSQVIGGKLLYMRMVKGENDAVYEHLYHWFRYLTNSSRGEVHYTKNTRIVYLSTMTKAEFEAQLATQIVIDPSASLPCCARFGEGSDLRYLAMTGKITPEILEQLASEPSNGPTWSKYRISLCNNGLSQFYMLHKRFAPRRYPTSASSHMSDLAVELAEWFKPELEPESMTELEAELESLDLDALYEELIELGSRRGRYKAVKEMS